MIARDFYKRLPGKYGQNNSMYRVQIRRDKENRIHVPMYSNLFSSMTESSLCTNRMYADLRNDILDSISMYKTDENIVIDIFEPDESTEFNRDRAILGFRRFIGASYASYCKELITHLIVFAAFLIVGILITVFVCETNTASIKNWILSCLETIASVFMWQFVGFMAFEFFGEVKNIRRYAQLMRIEFKFKLWE